MPSQSPEPWIVVLAAGAGRRLAGVTGDVPKQFWRSRGGRSLLEETLDRFAPIAPRSRTIIVVDRTHRPHVRETRGCEGTTIIFQPGNRGTAAGVLLGLIPVLASEPEAIVVITPADHGVRNHRRFRRGLREAMRSVESDGGIVLFGVEPAEPRDDYGWITPDRALSVGEGLRPVRAFIEKPHADVARRLLASGAVWNTMVVAARASALRALHAIALPQLARVFDAALALSPDDRAGYLSDAYEHLEAFDVSRDVIAQARGLSLYTWPASVGWSDLGTPDRLAAWYGRIAGLNPTRSEESLNAEEDHTPARAAACDTHL